MRTQTFDVVIIGQLVPIAAAKELIAGARQLNPAPAILAIRFPGEEVDFGVETHTTDMHDHPGWLRECVAGLIAQRTTAVRPIPS